MKKNALPLLFLLIITSCEFNYQTIPAKADLGPMPEVEKHTFNNIYVADENSCKDMGLPASRFAIEYPDGIEATFPNDKINHIKLKYIEDGIVTEELSIGYTDKVTIKTKNASLGLLEDFTSSIRKDIEGFELISVGKKKFDGEEMYLAEVKVDYSAYIDQGYNGIYKIMFLIPIPKKNENLNAIMISFLANENSSIKNFEDFANRGHIGKIYQTFRYIE